MNKELQGICKKNLFEKLYEIIESKTTKPSLLYKELNLSIFDFEALKEYVENKVLEFVRNNTKIPDSLLNLSGLLGESHMKSLQYSTTNYMLSQETADLTEYMTNNFKSLSSLKLIYDRLENQVEKVSNVYENIPSSWNLELKIITKSLVMIKQKICDHFFVSEVEENSYVMGLIFTMNFEKKLKPFFDSKKCCQCIINFHDEDIFSSETPRPECCIHAKMLSSVFIPYIDLYFKHYLSPFANMRYNQSICEFGIIEIFLLYFREVRHIYEKILYFDDEGIFNQFLSSLDQFLLILVRKINLEDTMTESLVVLNTIFYIRTTLDGLKDALFRQYGIEHEFTAIDHIQRIEKLQGYKIDYLVHINFPRLVTSDNNSESLKRYVDSLFYDHKDLQEHLKETMLESFMSQLFSRIGILKLDTSTAEQLLSDVSDLEVFLKQNFRSVPYMKTIKNYLKIFVCPTTDKEAFVNNFKAISENTFSFCQILNALSHQEDTAELFMAYKKASNNI